MTEAQARRSQLSHRAARSGPLNMRIAIVGGTGTVGAEAARDGSGLAAALDGVDVVVNAANGKRNVLVDGTARLLRAAQEAEVRHYVGVSIVGIDRVGIGYYRAKLAQEELIQRSGIPWTIVRATQFHPFLARTFATSAKLGIVPCLRFPMQPVDPREVGRVLAETAEAEPSRTITQFAGPEVVSGCDLARRWRERTGSHSRRWRSSSPSASGDRRLPATATRPARRARSRRRRSQPARGS